MKAIFRPFVLALSIGLFGVVSAYAQAVDCPAVFQAALEAARTHCAGLERNQACLAYGSATLQPAEGYDGATFAQPGDRIDAAALGSLTQAAGDGWALTLMRLQLNQLDTAPDYNSVLLVMGDVSLEQNALEAVETDEEIPGINAEINEALGEDGVPSPLQAFSFISSAEGPCSQELPRGIIIQSPNLTPADEAYLPAEVQVNGWHLSLGSTVLVNTGADGQTVAEVLEHFMSVEGADGDVLVLAGEGIELPPGTPYVGNEDGTVVVTPRPTPADETADWLDELFGEEEVANRAPEDTSSGRVEYITPGDQMVRDGVWKLDIYDDVSYGECVMDIWKGNFEPDYVTLDDVLHLGADGAPSSMTLWRMDYRLDDTGNDYEARKWGLGNMIYEQVNLEVTTPYFAHGRFVGVIRDQYAERSCIHIFNYSLTSCLMDVFYDDTNGGGDCSAEIHKAMGTG